MELIVIPSLLVGAAIYLGYTSITTEKVHSVIAQSPVPIYEMSSWYGSTSDTLRFNPQKQIIESYIGEFGIPEVFIQDGKGCLTRLSDIGIGSGDW